MNAQRSLPRRFRLLIVAGFFGTCAVFFGYFWTSAGGEIPGLTEQHDYQVAFTTKDTVNLAPTGEVRIAGVTVGEVVDRTLEQRHARVVISLDESAAPLHKGATVRIGMKSLVGSSYVDVVDGNGPEIPSGTALPSKAVLPSTDLRDVVHGIKPDARKALGKALQSLGTGTDGRQKEISQLMAGLGRIGREGHTAVDAIAAQSQDLTKLARETKVLIHALDTGRGEISTMVRDARSLTNATAGQRKAVEATMRSLPGLLGTVNSAAGDVTDLTGSLAPVTADLKTASRDLNAALVELPATTRDLRGLLPALDGTLNAAPHTLSRVPAVAKDVHVLIPQTRTLLRDVNPMLAYLEPYGRDIGAMFANFGASFAFKAEDGLNAVRLAPIFNEASVRGYPVPFLLPHHWTNPYPDAGAAGDPAPFKGKYPHVEREPR